MIIEAFKKIAKLNSKHNSIIHKMWKTDKETTKENEFQKRKEIIQMQKEAESEIEKIKQLQNEDKQVQELKKLGFGVSYDPTTQMMLLINDEKYPESYYGCDVCFKTKKILLRENWKELEEAHVKKIKEILGLED
ncbi:MAG: hypothetical protein PHE16_05425 [Aliarcobacter sp.]|nr:hypothetical protein [Aliarcobacter sp.]